MKSIARITAILLAVATCAALPAMADDTTPPATTPAPATPKPKAKGYAGKISNIDAATMTLTLTTRNGESKVKVTHDTKIKKDGVPAEFSDATVGLRISGSGKQDSDGVWTANTLNIRTKPATKPPAAATTPPADTK